MAYQKSHQQWVFLAKSSMKPETPIHKEEEKTNNQISYRWCNMEIQQTTNANMSRLQTPRKMK